MHLSYDHFILDKTPHELNFPRDEISYRIHIRGSQKTQVRGTCQAQGLPRGLFFVASDRILLTCDLCVVQIFLFPWRFEC